MRLAFWLCLAVSAMMSSPAWSEQQATRVALLVGNANYPDASTPLSTAIRDARSLAGELRRTGFEVDLKEDIGKAEMQRAIDALTGKIRPGMTALFYFSGYGIQVARQTYLIPVNAQVWAEADVRRDGINLDEVVAEIHRKGAKVKIVIVDAARRNPYERRFRSAAAGLAPIDAPENTLAIFSAAPGKLINEGTGSNSLFVGELLKEMRVPNVAAEEMLNRVRTGVSRASNNEQIPWVASSLVQTFYFGSSGPTAAPAGTGGECTHIEGRIVADMCNGCSKPPFTWSLDKVSADEWVSKYVDGNNKSGSNTFRTTALSSSEIVIFDKSRDYYLRFDLPVMKSFMRRGNGNWIMHSELLKTNCSGSPPAVNVVASAGVGQLTRSVESGVETNITHHASWDSGCNPRQITVTITRAPDAGTALVKDGSDRIPERPAFGTAGACAGRAIAGKHISYRSNAGFRGSDVVAYDVVLPGGNRSSYQVTINVR
jgi:hypothetical protein